MSSSKPFPGQTAPIWVALSLCGSLALKHHECDILTLTETTKFDTNRTLVFEVSHCVLLEAQQLLANWPVNVTRLGKDQGHRKTLADKGESNKKGIRRLMEIRGDSIFSVTLPLVPWHGPHKTAKLHS